MLPDERDRCRASSTVAPRAHDAGHLFGAMLLAAPDAVRLATRTGSIAGVHRVRAQRGEAVGPHAGAEPLPAPGLEASCRAPASMPSRVNLCVLRHFPERDAASWSTSSVPPAPDPCRLSLAGARCGWRRRRHREVAMARRATRSGVRRAARPFRSASPRDVPAPADVVPSWPRPAGCCARPRRRGRPRRRPPATGRAP